MRKIYEIVAMTMIGDGLLSALRPSESCGVVAQWATGLS